MDNTNNYVAIMIESLKKKISILDEIIKLNTIQNELLSEEKLDLEQFRENIDIKSDYVEKLTKIDDGFTVLYDRVKNTLDSRRAEYTNEIATMKSLIAAITERSVKVQTDEIRNKSLADRQFGNLRKKVVQAKKSEGMAVNYYKSMNHIDFEPQFLDKKN